MRVLLALHRIGPYHHSRFEAAAGLLDLHVLETRPSSQEYPWIFGSSAGYNTHRITGQPHPECDPPLRDLYPQLNAVLNQLQPEVIVSVGWADRTYQCLLVMAYQQRIPVVIVSDSRKRDGPRNFYKEWIKRQLLHAYSAAIVAGTESRNYLQDLDFPAKAIFEPWDVVDNQFFEQASRESFERQPHFLCVSRLVSKKNHAGLLRSYATYQQQGGCWGLRLVGSGPLEQPIRDEIASMPDPERVQLLHFSQLEELVGHYGKASAFVLASSTDQWGLVVNEAMASGLPCIVSTACGCTGDLIENGVSGWCFNPFNSAELTALMHCAEHQSSAERQKMLASARLRLGSYSLTSFAFGLHQSVLYAQSHPRYSWQAAVASHLLSMLP